MKLLKEKEYEGCLTESETQQLYNHKMAERYGIKPEVADAAFVEECCGDVSSTRGTRCTVSSSGSATSATSRTRAGPPSW